MRFPVKLNSINLLLIGLMLLAPILGKLARQELDSQREQEKISRMVLLSKEDRLKKPKPSSTNKKKALNPSYQQWLKNQKRKEKRDQKRKVETSQAQFPARPLAQPKRPEGDFMQRMKAYAKEDNWPRAENDFLSLLEKKGLPPLEALNKVREFKSRFEKLRNHFSSGESTSM